MRKFIVSDLHGNENIYDSIMAYLENINKEDEVTLYINGDLIDRGWASYEMLYDVYDRVINKKGFKIEYLGGDHELMMWQDSINIGSKAWPTNTNWYYNGGNITSGLIEINESLESRAKIIRFISNLKIYHKFEETLNGKRIVLVHAKCPSVVCDNSMLSIRDEEYKPCIQSFLWERKKECIGNDEYFTIVGHTIINNPMGYEYYKDYNYMDIDGGCASYVLGYTNVDHVPLVEVLDEKLNILTFNNSNDIIMANEFYNNESHPIYNLDNYKKYLDKKVKVKRPYIEDGIIFFK